MRKLDPQAVIKTFSLVFPNLEIDESTYWNWKVVLDNYIEKRSKRRSSAFAVGEEICRIIIVELWLRHWIDSRRSDDRLHHLSGRVTIAE
jgi:hypothetical protein